MNAATLWTTTIQATLAACTLGLAVFLAGVIGFYHDRSKASAANQTGGELRLIASNESFYVYKIRDNLNGEVRWVVVSFRGNPHVAISP